MNLNKLVVVHLNVNSVRNKLGALIRNVRSGRITDDFRSKN